MKKLLALFGLLAFALAACGGAGVGAADAPTSGPLTDADTGAASLDLTDPTNFREPPGSYEIAMRLVFSATREDGTPVNGEVIVDGAAQTEPPARTFTFTGSGDIDLTEGDTVQVVTIGDVSYFYTSQAGCISMSTPQGGTPFDSMVDTGGMITNVVQRVLPDETVNGVPSYRYALTEANINDDGSALGMTEVTNGMMYIAKDGGYIVRMVLEGRGTSEDLTDDPNLEGDISYTLDLTPVASIGEITIPEGCEAAESSQGEFPVMADAVGVASFQGFVSYQSPSDMTTIMNFYKAQMPAAGWTLEEESTVANIGFLRYALDDRTVSVAITYDPNQGMSSVIVGEE